MSDLVKQLLEGEGDYKEFKVGKGSGILLLDPWENDIYLDIMDGLDADYNRCVFLENLRNGGEKGAGLMVLKKIDEWCKSRGYTMLLLVVSDTNQEKLVDWYLSTGILERAKTPRNTLMKNVLIQKGRNWN